MAEICTEPQSNPSQYSQWRDPFIAHAAKAFKAPQHTRQEARLEPENTRRKRLARELLWEVTKSDEVFG